MRVARFLLDRWPLVLLWLFLIIALLAAGCAAPPAFKTPAPAKAKLATPPLPTGLQSVANSTVAFIVAPPPAPDHTNLFDLVVTGYYPATNQGLVTRFGLVFRTNVPVARVWSSCDMKRWSFTHLVNIASGFTNEISVCHRTNLNQLFVKVEVNP